MIDHIYKQLRSFEKFSKNKCHCSDPFLFDHRRQARIHFPFELLTFFSEGNVYMPGHVSLKDFQCRNIQTS